MSEPRLAADVEAHRPTVAVAAFCFGVASVLLSPFLVGFPLGALGLGVGLVHVLKGWRPRGLAIWGSALSALAMVASLAAGVWYIRLLWQRPPTFFLTSRQRPNDDWASWRGKAVPGIRVTTTQGESLDLASLRGRVVVLDFWATWCRPCVKVIPHLNQLASQWGNDVVVVGITGEDRDTVDRFITEHPMEYRVVAGLDDQTLPEPFHSVSAIPTLFFIGRDGILRSVLVGGHGYDALEAQVWVSEAAEQLAKGRTTEALRLATTALEAKLDGPTEVALHDVFGEDAAYAETHERVRSRIEGLLGHYEGKYGKSFDRDRASVVWVIWSLGAERKDKGAVPHLVRYLQESVLDEARWRAADALWQIGDRRAVPHLMTALGDTSPEVAGFAASGLGDLGDASAVTALLALFEKLPDNRDDTKARVAEALGKLGDPRAIGPLATSLETLRDPAYVRWAEPALRRLKGKPRPS